MTNPTGLKLPRIKLRDNCAAPRRCAACRAPLVSGEAYWYDFNSCTPLEHSYYCELCGYAALATGKAEVYS